MRCPSCGANVDSAYCGYCGSKMPAERVETRSIHAENIVVNNYYYPEPPHQPRAANVNAAPQVAPPLGAVPAAYGVSPKSRAIALILCFFLGIFGAHRFYAGRILMGVIYLFTLGGLGVAWLVDLLLILFGRMRDSNRLPITTW